MGSTRHSAVFILFPVLFKVTFGQQFGFGNIQDCSTKVGVSSDQNTQRLYNLISSAQGTNCNPKPLTGLQQFLNCQKPSNQQANCSPCVSAQQSLNPVQQSQGQQNINQNDFYTLPLNLQRKILQQIQQLQGASSQTNNVQAPEQSAYYQPSQGSFPTVNQVSGVPSQVPQSLLLNNLGMTSSLPSLVSSACNPNQNTNQVVFSPQNAVATLSNNVPTPSSAPPPEGCFSTKFIPISAIPTSNPTQNSYMVPVSPENISTNQVQNSVQNTAVEKQNMPVQFTYQPVQQPAPVQQSVPVQSQQSAVSQPVAPQGVDPQAILASYVMSQLGYPNGAPYSQYMSGFAGYPSYQPAPVPNMATVATPNQGSKSSTVKALVPLLLNMLRDKGDCGCPNNNNCESFNENRNNDLPQVNQGYANQFNYGQKQESSETAYENASKNTIGSKEELSDKEKKTYQKSKHKTSEEEDDEQDSYEEDDFEDDTSS